MLTRLSLLTLLLVSISSSAQAFEVCAAAKDPAAYVANDRWAVIAEQGADGWIFAQGELLRPADMGGAVGVLTRMAAALRKHGTLPILVPIPNRLTLAEDKIDASKPEFSSYKAGSMPAMYTRHLNALKKTGWQVTDLVALGKSSGLGAEFFNDKDHHWSTQGARVTAGLIAQLVEKHPGWAGVAKTAFELEVREVRNPGSYRWVVLDRCGIDIPAEVTKSYKAKSQAEVSADSLLGDAPPADVVLIGTSQSRRQDFDAIGNRQYFEDSFSALLRHSLSVDVLNLAAAGGGTFTSVDGWLTSKEFQKQKPKVVVWEMNDSEGFEQPAFLRTLVPAVHGRCSKDAAIARASGSVEGTVELAVPAGRKVIGDRYYLALKLSDSSIVDFKVTFDHGGSRDAVPMKRSPLLPNSGLFFTELSGAMKKPLTSVRISLPADGSGRFDARICEAP